MSVLLHLNRLVIEFHLQLELYVKIGLFDEASLLLKDDDNRVADYYYYKEQSEL